MQDGLTGKFTEQLKQQLRCGEMKARVRMVKVAVKRKREVESKITLGIKCQVQKHPSLSVGLFEVATSRLGGIQMARPVPLE